MDLRRILSKSKFLQKLKSDVLRKTTYFSMPPYNIQWIRSFKFADKFLQANPITLVDIGSRDGGCEELISLRKYINYIGFDADANSTNSDKELNLRLGYKSFRLYPKFIGSHEGTIRFKLYKRRSESSNLSPGKIYQKYFSKSLKVEEIIDVSSIILEKFMSKIKTQPDIIKLDTQGTEFQIINSSKTLFTKTLIVEVEVEFVEMYQNQKLYFDVCKILDQLGFQILYINRVFGNMNNGFISSRGQLLFGDALFGMTLERAFKLSLAGKAKYCLLLINYGHMDFAYEVYKSEPMLNDLIPEMKVIFENSLRNSLTNKITRVLRMKLDRVAFNYLRIRKTNGLLFDSDRSYPIR